MSENEYQDLMKQMAIADRLVIVVFGFAIFSFLMMLLMVIKF